MTSPGRDQDLDDLLAGRSDLARRYRASSTAEPPATLDQRVLAQAAAAVSQPAKDGAANGIPLPARSRARWMVPFAVAATVLLSFAIFREAGVEMGTPSPPPVQAQFAEERVATVERADEAERAEAAKAVADTVPPGPPPAPVTTPPVALQAPEIAVTASEAPATSAIQGLTRQRPSPGAPPRDATETVDVDASRARPAPMTALGVAPPAVPAPATPLSAEDWLRDIRTLRNAGLHEEADSALRNFLNAFPDYFERNPGVARP